MVTKNVIFDENNFCYKSNAEIQGEQAITTNHMSTPLLFINTIDERVIAQSQEDQVDTKNQNSEEHPLSIPLINSIMCVFRPCCVSILCNIIYISLADVMILYVQIKGKSVKRSKSVERSASKNGACRDQYE